MYGSKMRDSIKAKCEKNLQFYSNFTRIMNLILGTFEYDGLPEEIESTDIERFNVMCGSCVMDKVNETKYIVDFPTYADITFYPWKYKNATVTNPLYMGKTKLLGKEIPVCYNNAMHSPDFDLLQVASFFTEIDTSLGINILNSRLTKVIPVADEDTKNTVKEMLKQIYNGVKNVCFVKKPSDLIEYKNGNKPIEPIGLTDPKDVERLHYLNDTYDTILRRLCNNHGIKMHTGGKMAQLTTEEIDEYSELAKVYITNQLKEREKFCKQCNEIFGLNMSVHVGKPWEKLMNENNENDNVSRETLDKESEENENDIE